MATLKFGRCHVCSSSKRPYLQKWTHDSPTSGCWVNHGRSSSLSVNIKLFYLRCLPKKDNNKDVWGLLWNIKVNSWAGARECWSLKLKLRSRTFRFSWGKLSMWHFGSLRCCLTYWYLRVQGHDQVCLFINLWFCQLGRRGGNSNDKSCDQKLASKLVALSCMETCARHYNCVHKQHD